jgi:hypothetical protein
MRTALLIAVHIGGEITELLRGRETPLDEQRAEFKRLRLAGDNHDKWESLELWQSDGGIVVKHRFKPVPTTPVVPATVAAPAAPPPTPETAPEVTTAPPEPDDEPSDEDSTAAAEPVEGEVAAPADDDEPVAAPAAPTKGKGKGGRR